MCERFAKNREKLADLVYDLETFSEKHILEVFKKQQHGDIVIDGSQTVTQYLRDLREQGALHFSHGKYSVPDTRRMTVHHHSKT